MRMLIAISLVAAGFGLALVGGKPAYARTRTPTPTATPTGTATPVPPQPAWFGIIPWVNGQNDAYNVTAKIGGTTCATGLPVVVGGSRLIFSVSVPSAEALPGCGREGAVVTFFVDGQQAAQTAIWHSGDISPP